MLIDVEYLHGMFPLFFSQIMVPPLSLLDGNIRLSDYPEFIEMVLVEIYKIIPPKLLSIDYIDSLCCDMNTKNSSEWDWRRISYMFIHSDFEHLFGNLKAAYIFGYPLYKECGLWSVYTTFIFGGIAAVWPSPLHDKQITQFTATFEDSFSQYIPSFVRNIFPTTVQNQIGHLSTFFGKKILEFLPRKACGSSGAACALLGSSLIIVIQDLHQCISDIINENTNGGMYSQYRTESASNNSKKASLMVSILQDLLFLITAVSFISGEVHMISLSREDALQISNTYGLLSLRMISHSGHVQGALFGMCWQCVRMLRDA